MLGPSSLTPYSPDSPYASYYILHTKPPSLRSTRLSDDSIPTHPIHTLSTPSLSTTPQDDILPQILSPPPPFLFSPLPYHIFGFCGLGDVGCFLRPFPIDRYWRALWAVPSLLFFPFSFLSPLVIRLPPLLPPLASPNISQSSNKKGPCHCSIHL